MRPAHRVLAVTVALIAVVTAAAGPLPFHAVYLLADQGWFSWPESVGLAGLVLGNAFLLVLGVRSWAAALFLALSVAANFAAIGMLTHPWMGWIVVVWPVVAVPLSYVTLVRGAHLFSPSASGTQPPTVDQVEVARRDGGD